MYCKKGRGEMSYLKYFGYGVLIVLLTSGCVRRVRHIPIEPIADENETTPVSTGTLYDTSRTEHKYKLKPEPYSVSSKEKDPELLGPQRTLNTSDHVTETVVSQPTSTTPAPAKKSATAMTKSECVSMIGATKFERYSKRFGGDTGAIKRCAILKKLKRG